ncbi:MAG: peptidylprolyl isomerase [Planctomycetota bacterium]|jgi:hypothetical protein
MTPRTTIPVILLLAAGATACAGNDELSGAAAARSRGASLPAGDRTTAPAAPVENPDTKVDKWLDDARVLARVNGRTISLREIRHRMGPSYDAYLNRRDDLEVLVRKTVRDEVLRHLVTEEAKRVGLDVNEEEMRRIRENWEKQAAARQTTLEMTISDLGMTRREWEDQQRRSYLYDKAVRLFTGLNKWQMTAAPYFPSVDVYVSPAEIRTYGERHPEISLVPASATLRVIDLRWSRFQEGDDVSEEAAWGACGRALDLAEERIRDGESFADVARDISHGPEAKTGGLLGPFDNQGNMVMADGSRRRLRKEYVRWAYSPDRREGDTSERLKMRFGFLVFHLVNRVEEHRAPIEEWGPNVRAALERIKLDIAFTEVRIGLLEEAVVTPAELRSTLLSEMTSHLRGVRKTLR